MTNPLINTCLQGDAIEQMQVMQRQGIKAQTCVTSPPYWQLRDYHMQGQIGMETSLDEYIERLVETFSMVRDVLSDDGTLWLNIGDKYAGTHSGTRNVNKWPKQSKNKGSVKVATPKICGIKNKDLIGIPWLLAFALRSDGWYLRAENIWHKTNPMPESVTDRPTKAHEQIFLLSKKPSYYFDHEAVRTKYQASSVQRYNQDIENQQGSKRANAGAKTNGTMKAVGSDRIRDSLTEHQGFKEKWDGMTLSEQRSNGANIRSVWTVATKPYRQAHFATFPPELIKPCVLAGSKPGDIVLDPFMGSGTTAQVAIELGRQWIGCELNPDYIQLQHERLSHVTQGMPV